MSSFALVVGVLLSATFVPASTAFVHQSYGSPSRTRSALGLADRPYFVPGPPAEDKPDFDNIHGPMGKVVDDVFLSMFRTRLAEQVGVDSDKPKTDYQGIMELVKAMNARYSDRTEIQKRSQKTLSLLFPGWMPPNYAILFSKPFPGFASRMNAWATMMAGTWLMGECEVNDVEIDDKGTIGKDQGLMVKRCRFLEESQCASVCVNSCKIPTQNFFIEEMGLPLTMTPDYETFECQFAFGKMPDEQSELEAKNTPCLSKCPSAGGLREWHNDNNNKASSQKTEEEIRACELMGD